MKIFLPLLSFILFLAIGSTTLGQNSPELRYKAIQTKLKTGWGAFNHKSVLSHVLLPEGLALNIGIKLHQNNADNYLKEAYISSRGNRGEKITPGYKAYHGSYSELTVEWNGVKLRIESATAENQDLVLLVSPIQLPENIPAVVLETGFLWNRKGNLELIDNKIVAKTNKKRFTIHSIGVPEKEYLANTSPYLAVKFDLNIVQNLKLRGSWGKLGNNAPGNYDYMSLYNPVSYSYNGLQVTGLAPGKIPNALLQWESTTVANLGLDATLLDGWLYGEIEAYNKVTDGILTTPPIYLTLGLVGAPTLNTAEVTNKGIELTFGWKDKIGEVKYSINGNSFVFPAGNKRFMIVWLKKVYAHTGNPQT